MVRALFDYALPQRLQEWLYSQGVSTVLLFLILCSLPWVSSQVSSHLDKINDGSNQRADKANESYERRTKMLIEAFEKDQDRDNDLIRDLMNRHGLVGDNGFAEEID